MTSAQQVSTSSCGVWQQHGSCNWPCIVLLRVPHAIIASYRMKHGPCLPMNHAMFRIWTLRLPDPPASDDMSECPDLKASRTWGICLCSTSWYHHICGTSFLLEVCQL
jgi:hypothetical protein